MDIGIVIGVIVLIVLFLFGPEGWGSFSWRRKAKQEEKTLSPEEPLQSIGPLRHLDQVLDTVAQLNQWGEEILGKSCATFIGNSYYLAIQWEDILLWDSEDSHLVDREFPEQFLGEPRLNSCLWALKVHIEELAHVLDSMEWTKWVQS